MDAETLNKFLLDRELLVKSIKESNDKLKKMDAALKIWKDIYPDLFTDRENGRKNDEVKIINNFNFSTGEALEWDVSLPLRKRVWVLLDKQGRFIKVGELAKIALHNEPFYSTETMQTMQDKISRTLTYLKKIPASGVVMRKIHSGASGVAWGLNTWKEVDEHSNNTYYEQEDIEKEKTA